MMYTFGVFKPPLTLLLSDPILGEPSDPIDGVDVNEESEDGTEVNDERLGNDPKDELGERMDGEVNAAPPW